MFIASVLSNIALHYAARIKLILLITSSTLPASHMHHPEPFRKYYMS
jgi:hypothetical protein